MTTVTELDEIDFGTTTLDHLDEQFSHYGCVDPHPTPLQAEDDDNYIAALYSDIAIPSEAQSTCYDVDELQFTSSDILNSDTVLLAAAVEHCPPATRALHALGSQIRDMKLSHSARYHELRQIDTVIGSKTDVVAHIDAGAMTSTTDLLKLLWHVTDISIGSIVLAVADGHKHYPTKLGYLRVSTHTGNDGSTLIPCYYTPTLPATIISPDAAGRSLHCQGYTSVSTFDGSLCNVTLRHCRRSAQDVVIPATLRRGLLFTDPLLLPSKAERTSVRPITSLPVLAVSFGRHEDVHSSTPDTQPCDCNTSTDAPADTSSVPGASDSSSQPGPATASAPNDIVHDSPDTTIPELREKILQYQRHGFQPDVSIASMFETSVVDTGLFPGVFDESTGCGTCSSSTCACTTSTTPPSSAGTCSCGEEAGRKLDDFRHPFDITTPPSYKLAMRGLTRDQQRILWHQRLNHLHSRRVSVQHKYAVGIPKVSIAGELEKCSICLHAKLRKAARSQDTSRRATTCFQGLSVDFGFIVQGSKNTARTKRLTGINGETCYCLIVDHFSGTLYGETFRTKAPPIDFINRWLAQHAPSGESVPDRYVRFDLGGELGHSPRVVELFEKAGYRVEPTAPMASHSNAPAERPHQTIGDALRAMLAGADLQSRFWPYAFHHHLRLYNVTVHGTSTQSPFEICRGVKPNLSYLRTFGCRVYVLPPRPHRPDKPLSDARVGTFLGFARTTKNILYYDLATHSVKTAQHIVFDEAMSDLPLEKRSYNARLLNACGNVDEIQDVDLSTVYPDLEVSRSPFTGFNTLTFPLDLTADLPLGFSVVECDRLKRGFLESISVAAVGKTLKATRKAFAHSYVVSINGNPVFSPSDVKTELDTLRASRVAPTTVEVVLAPERQADFDDRPSPVHMRLSDLRRIHALLHVDDTSTLPANMRAAVDELYDDLTPIELAEVISQVEYSIGRLHTDAMTAEERALPSFTRNRLKKLANWDQWDNAHDAQLDSHFDSGTLGKALKRPRPLDGTPPNVLRPHWANQVKTDGVRKARMCLNGSKRAAPWLHGVAQTYASCIEQPCMRLFFALAAIHGCTVTIADTKNAFQQSPPPTEQCYVAVDDAIQSWYSKRFGVQLDPKTDVVPLNKACQGHPEAGKLWEAMIGGVLSDLGFKNTTHERNLYRGLINGKMVLVCRQVDDFAVASESTAAASELVSLINARVTTVDKGIGDITINGAFSQYNGVDIHQTRDYIKMSCESYITRVLQTHGWTTPERHQSDRHDSVPLSPSLVTSLSKLQGPAEGTPEYAAIAATAGFSYRQILGELMYAYVVGRLDIGYAVTFLARFSQYPTSGHYAALKSVVKYLRRTKTWGLIYWRPSPLDHLPHVPIDQLPLDPSIPSFPCHPLSELVGYVDAAHATDLATRRSVTGLVFTLAGGAIAFKSKVQKSVSTSSTEAELIAAVTAAKMAKYFRYILFELGFPPDGPTVLYEDNEATIAMINENRPTARARHVDVQFFAIQEWRRRNDIVLRHISTTINIADAGTKSLGWTLHSRHVRRSMGHYGPPQL